MEKKLIKELSDILTKLEALKPLTNGVHITRHHIYSSPLGTRYEFIDDLEGLCQLTQDAIDFVREADEGLPEKKVKSDYEEHFNQNMFM